MATAKQLHCSNCLDPTYPGHQDALERAYRCSACGAVLCAHCKLQDACCGGANEPEVKAGDRETREVQR